MIRPMISGEEDQGDPDLEGDPGAPDDSAQNVPSHFIRSQKMPVTGGGEPYVRSDFKGVVRCEGWTENGRQDQEKDDAQSKGG